MKKLCLLLGFLGGCTVSSDQIIVGLSVVQPVLDVLKKLGILLTIAIVLAGCANTTTQIDATNKFCQDNVKPILEEIAAKGNWQTQGSIQAINPKVAGELEAFYVQGIFVRWNVGAEGAALNLTGSSEKDQSLVVKIDNTTRTDNITAVSGSSEIPTSQPVK